MSVETRMAILESYNAGWRSGDLEVIQEATAPEYQLVTTAAGTLTADRLGPYLDSLKGGSTQDPFMDLEDIATVNDGPILTAWRRWSIPGFMRGAAMIKIIDEGVISEHVYNG